MPIYQIQNTGTSTYVGFTFTDILTSLKVFDLQPSLYYYVNSSGTLISPSPDVIVTLIDKELVALELSGCCNNENIAITVGRSYSFFTLGDVLYFTELISSSNPNVNLDGCFQIVSSGLTSALPYYTILSSDNYRLGTSYNDCTDCISTNPCPTPSVCEEIYCINNTNSIFDDTYYSGGTYNSQLYWSGVSNNFFIYYSIGFKQWCLSTSLGGTCLLSGKSPCFSECPDLCEDIFSVGICPTTTTTTEYCEVFDFSAVFDCEVSTTSTPTPTPSQTPTPTPTPTNSICANLNVDATIQFIPISSTPTPTPTPTPTIIINRPCNIVGDVSFTTVEGDLSCPVSKQFQDCVNGMMYFTTMSVPTPLGDPLEEFMIFKALVDGVSRCISYVGVNPESIGMTEIILTEGPVGYFNLGQCVECLPDVSPTPTPTPTPTVTPTYTPTPTPSLPPQFYVYKNCEVKYVISRETNNTGVVQKYLIQTVPGPSLNSSQIFQDLDGNCWSFYNIYPTNPYSSLPPGSSIINYTGNYFTGVNNPTFYNNCTTCLSSVKKV